MRRTKNSPSELKSRTKRAQYGRIGNGNEKSSRLSVVTVVRVVKGRQGSSGVVRALAAVHPHVEIDSIDS